MSKGGAGKVYFVLYLAVVLELLIIIVERDEAEEHLHQKQKAAEAIVRSILSQLQSGAGTEGINTRPQDEITLEPDNISAAQVKEIIGVELKTNRRYTVEVGVTDILAEVKRREGEEEKEYLDRLNKLKSLANVSEIEYQIFHSTSEDPENAPDFPTEKELKDKKVDLTQPGQILESATGGQWTFKGKVTLQMDDTKTYENIIADLDDKKANLLIPDMHPVYKEPIEFGDISTSFKPRSGMAPDEKIFYYSDTLSMKSSGVPIGVKSNKGISKRVFIVNFEPPRQKGWYKLRFYSRTNRVLGVKRSKDESLPDAEVADDAKVNIGTVAVKVGDLRKVQKSLKNELEAYGIPDWEVLRSNDEAVDKFDLGIVEAKAKAIEESKDNVNQILSNMNLYNYIAKLLTPGQYENFDQNKGSIEFNVRVLQPTVKSSEPVIIAEDDVYRFDGVEPAFYFTMSPFQGDNQNILGGTIYGDESMTKMIGKMDLKPLNATPPPSGASREYIASFDRELKGGSGGAESIYYVKLTHAIQGKQTEKVVRIHIFPSVYDASITELTNKLAFSSYFNYTLTFQFAPSSGNKIKNDQFKIKFKRDFDNSEKVVSGYTARTTDEFKLTANTKSASIKVVWQDPITQREVTLFEKGDITARLQDPTLNRGDAQLVAAPSKKDIFCSVTGLKIKDNNAASEDMKVTYKAKVVKIETDLGGISGNPSDLNVTDNTIDQFAFSITGNFKRRELVEGSVKITLQITIVASNGATSTRQVTADLPVSVQF